MSNPPPARRILVVCLGNWCRSPMAAAAIARHGGPRVEVKSAGLAGKHAGQPAHPAMITAAAALGYDLNGHRAQQVSSGLLAWADVILTMDTCILASLQDLLTGQDQSRLRLYLPGQDVPDPLGHSDEVFAACAAMIEAGADQDF
jgi:protein-tyrosine phosphatase